MFEPFRFWAAALCLGLPYKTTDEGQRDVVASTPLSAGRPHLQQRLQARADVAEPLLFPST